MRGHPPPKKKGKGGKINEDDDDQCGNSIRHNSALDIKKRGD